LAIVKKIVEEHRGTIHLNTNHQNGAEFIIRLPLTHHFDRQSSLGEALV